MLKMYLQIHKVIFEVIFHFFTYIWAKPLGVKSGVGDALRGNGAH